MQGGWKLKLTKYFVIEVRMNTNSFLIKLNYFSIVKQFNFFNF